MAERIKIDIGCACPGSQKKTMKVKGRNLTSGLPDEIKLDSEELSRILFPIVEAICEMIEATLEESPPELAGDIMERGIFLTGGGACLEGLDKYIFKRTHLPVKMTPDPLFSVVLGVEKLLDDGDLLSLVEITPDFK